MKLKMFVFWIGFAAVILSFYMNIQFGLKVGGFMFWGILLGDPVKLLSLPLALLGLKKIKPIIFFPSVGFLLFGIFLSQSATMGFIAMGIQDDRQEHINASTEVKAAVMAVENAKRRLEGLEAYSNVDANELKQNLANHENILSQWWSQKHQNGCLYKEIMDTGCNPQYCSLYKGLMKTAARELCSQYHSFLDRNDLGSIKTQLASHIAKAT